jgi:DNA-binding MarR family transcriptional regulator
MGAIPPVIWYMRKQMRQNRGGLSIPQFRALVRVEREPLTSITAISEHLVASLSTTSRLISGLVTRQYLDRETAPVDRRQARVRITPKGRAVLQTAREATARELESVFASVGSREIEKIIDAMRILRSVFGSGIPEPRSAENASASNGNGRSGSAKRNRAARV